MPGGAHHILAQRSCTPAHPLMRQARGWGLQMRSVRALQAALLQRREKQLVKHFFYVRSCFCRSEVAQQVVQDYGITINGFANVSSLAWVSPVSFSLTCGSRFHSSRLYPDSGIAVDDDLPGSNWALAVYLSEWICLSMSVSVPADHLEPSEHAVDRPGGRARRSGHLAGWPGQSGELQ